MELLTTEYSYVSNKLLEGGRELAREKDVYIENQEPSLEVLILG